MDQPGMAKDCQMRRQGIGPHADLAGDFPSWQAASAGSHQQPENGEAVPMRKRRECLDSFGERYHATTLTLTYRFDISNTFEVLSAQVTFSAPGARRRNPVLQTANDLVS